LRTGCLAVGPSRFDRHSEEWVVTITLPPGHEDRPFDEQLAAAGVRERLGLSDLDLKVIRFTRWRIDALLADRYRAGRILIAG
jgi:2,4-dichlorophenol 6-monooxygenase